MAGDLRSSILTTAAVAVSVVGLTVVQPLTAAPPLLLASLFMNGGSANADGVSSIAEAIQGRLLPSDGRSVFVNFLTGPFGLWNPLDPYDKSDGTVPSTSIGVASALPFMSQQGLALQPPALPALAGPPPNVPLPDPQPGQVFNFSLPSLQIGEAIVTSPPVGPHLPVGDVVSSYGYDLASYAGVTVLNPFALTNSVAAYLNGALSPVVVTPDGQVVCRQSLTCKIENFTIIRNEVVDGVRHITFKSPDGTTFQATVVTRNGVTYVTYEDDGPLPLVRPLRDYGGLLGNELADLIEPALTALVYWGYRDATNGTGGLLPTIAETIKTLLDFIVGVKQGIESLFKGHVPASELTTELARTERGTEVTGESTPDEQNVPETRTDDDAPQKPRPTLPVEPTTELPDPIATELDPAGNPVDENLEQVPGSDDGSDLEIGTDLDDGSDLEVGTDLDADDDKSDSDPQSDADNGGEKDGAPTSGSGGSRDTAKTSKADRAERTGRAGRAADRADRKANSGSGSED